MTIDKRVKELRNLMKEREIDAYIIPTSDPHKSEYIADRYKTREWISGFTGSAGTVVITKDKALLWADGRYFTQAANEIKGSEFQLQKLGLKGVLNHKEWLKKNLNHGDTVGLNGKVFSQKDIEDLEEKLKDKDINIIDKYDLIDEIWKDRPMLPIGDTFIHEKKYTGMDALEKIEKVRKNLKEKNGDYLVLGGLDDIAWLYNIRGNDIKNNPVVISYAVVGKDNAYLFVHKDKLNEKVKNYLKENEVEIRSYDEIDSFLEVITKDSNIVLDKTKLNGYLYSKIKDKKIINQRDITTTLKAIKNEVEIKNQKNAYIKDGVALCKFFYWLDKNIGKTEITEITAAEKLEGFRKEQDMYLEPSFDTISAYGENAAMAHYKADEKNYSTLKNKGMYLVDSGGQYLDGTTDITRTVALGEVTDEEKIDFTLCLKGHINLADTKFLENTTGHQLDAICRKPLWQEGIDYKHGTGHGVGYLLNVHEGPHRIATQANSVNLEKGMVVSIEPGVYKEGRHGIRIENIVLVEEAMETEFGEFLKFEVLSFAPIDLNLIDEKLLSGIEKSWLNNYHKDVYEKISPYLNGEEKEWLKEKTSFI